MRRAHAMAGSWADDDELWSDLLPALADLRRARIAVDDARALVALLGLASPSRILDVGCGAGMHAIELARLGHRAVGLDRSGALLDVARERGRAAGVGVEWMQQDMRALAVREPVDAVLSLYASFGCFEAAEDDAKVARGMRAALAEGGRALLDLVGKETALVGFFPRAWARFDDLLLLEERTIAPGWEWLESRWTVIRGGEERAHVTRQRLYAGTELRALLLACGFSRVDLFGGLDGRPYDRAAQRLVAVAAR